MHIFVLFCLYGVAFSIPRAEKNLWKFVLWILLLGY